VPTFVFYFTAISAIIPPVQTSFAAAGVTRARPWKTAWITLNVGLAVLIVPVVFVYSPIPIFLRPRFRIPAAA